MLSLGRLALLSSLAVQPGRCGSAAGWELDGYHVVPGGNIQEALDEAARNPTNKVVKVHAGIYRPQTPGQALIWFNRSHEGVKLEAVGQVTLTAANPNLSESRGQAYPAMVNHVVYFGDGVSANTLFQGFRITGANHFVTTNPPQIEPGTAFRKDLFFYADGGAVKVFGRSCPTLRDLEILDNYASPCAGGISVQQQAIAAEPKPGAVRIENCVFRQNRSQITGAAVDLLPGSFAVISNCLFIGNMANLGVNYIAENQAQPEFTNSAPLTVFPTARAIVQYCTFTGNRNGVEDLGRQSAYQNCVFWDNNLGGAYYGGKRYDLDLAQQAQVSGCFFGGQVLDPGKVISKESNVFHAPDPKFDSQFKPTSPEYQSAGIRFPILTHSMDKQ